MDITIGNKIIGKDHPCFIIGEVGVNHNGSVDIALQLVDQAAIIGVDAVKFQTFRAESLVTANAACAGYQIANIGNECSQYDMLKGLELSKEDFKRIADHCILNNIMFLSTPFDLESVDLLEEIGVQGYKIGSGDITNHQLLQYVGKCTKPVILSSGAPAGKAPVW